LVLNIAHRGFSGCFPENTLLSFRKAMELGVDAIELDVQLSRDGELMIFHDEELQRTTGEKGWLKGFTYSELRQLDASGVYHGEYGENRIPTLDEYLNLIVGSEVITFIELKNSMVCYPGMEEKVAEHINNFGENERFILYSANHHSVKTFGEMMPDVPLLFSFDNWLFNYGAYCRSHGISNCMPYFRSLNPEVVAEIKLNGVSIYPWTVDQSDDMRAMLDLCVDGVLTNRPDRLQSVIESP